MVERLADELITNGTVAGTAPLYVRELILSIGGYSEDLLVEDWDFYLRLDDQGSLADRHPADVAAEGPAGA